VADKDTDNGTIVAKDAWQGMQYYSVKDSTGVEGVILEQAANGNWYVEITKPGDGIFIYQVPMIDETYNRSFQKESNFYNEQGDKMRGYKLVEGDVVEVSEELFSTNTPAATKTVKITARKYAVQA